MTAAAVITRAVQSVGVKRVGYSGLMVPVLEDAVLAKRWAEGTYTMDALLAYSAVCAGGSGHHSASGRYQRRAIVAASWATWPRWPTNGKKPLAARLLPAPGRKSGERTEFEDSRMANTVIH